MIWRAEAIERLRWNHTAQITYFVARGLLKGQFVPEDFHPYLRKDSSIAEIRMPVDFPVTLTESEIWAEWEKVKEKIHG